MSTPDYEADAKKLTKILRDGGYSYRQSARLIMLARKSLGLKPKQRMRGEPDKLSIEQIDALVTAAYELDPRTGIMIRTLLDTGMRVGSFARLQIEDISFRELEIKIEHKGRRRHVPITRELARELRLFFGDRETGWAWQSRQGGHLSTRRVQQILKEVAEDAGITRSVHPHLLRKTIAQRLSDAGMPEEHLQAFLGHEKPETTQKYYRASRSRTREEHRKAMRDVYE